MSEPTLRFSSAALRLFEMVFRPFQRTRIATAFHVPADLDAPADRPVVFVANHVSWWDGFLVRDLHRRLAPRSPLFTLMLERELDRRPFLARLGAVPLDPRPASVLRAFRALERRRQRAPNFCVACFAQGTIRPAWSRPLRLQRGVELLIERLAPCLVVPVALHIEPLNRVRPTAFVWAGAPLHAGARVAVADLEARLRILLDGLLAHVAEHGERAAMEAPRAAAPGSPYTPPLGRTPR